MLLIDAHVHIYDCFDLEKFLDSAYENFKTEADKQGHADDFTGVLLLAETSKDNWFQHLSDYADGKKLPGNKTAGAWKFNRTDDLESLCARSDDKRELFLIAGRQIVTAEGLELLALATIDSFEDGTSIKQLIKIVRKKGAIPVIPWGFGKWMGQRGTFLNQFIEEVEDTGLFLGDNSGRPNFWHRPKLLKKGESKDIQILPGSDPLPLANEFNRVGNFGFAIHGELLPDYPAKNLKRILLNSTVHLQPYGRLEQPLHFFHNQLNIRLRHLFSG